MAGRGVRLNLIMANNSGDAHEWFRTVVVRFEGPLVRYAKSITGEIGAGDTVTALYEVAPAAGVRGQ
jgi:hypothetical protein